MSFSLLLFLGLLGFVGCHLASDQNPRSFDEGPLSPDGSEITVDAILETIRDAISAYDTSSINYLMSNEFVYRGCKSDLNKTEAMDWLLFPRKSKVLSFKHYCSRYVDDNNDIEFTMASSKETIPGRFVVHNRGGRHFMASGTSIDCSMQFVGARAVRPRVTSPPGSCPLPPDSTSMPTTP